MRDSTLKVAIIRLSSLGDIISTMVFLDFICAKFRQRGQKIEITFIVDTQFREILADSAMIDRIIDLPLRASKKNKKLLFEIYKKTRQIGHFDILIDAQGLLKSALIGVLIKKKKFVGFSADSAREKVASLFYNKRAKIPYNEHILRRQYELFKVAFDCVDWEGDFRLEMLDSRNHTIDSSKSAKVKIAEIIAQSGKNTKNLKTAPKILFLCETSKADKEFALDSFYTLAEGLWSEYENAKIFLIWDKKESEIRALGAKDSRFCVLPHLDFDEIKALLGSMDLVIGGDTGITHSAWAMRVPSVTLYVSTNIKRFALGGENHFSIAVGNSPLELHSADSANFGRSQTPSLVSRPKFAENHESQTENPSVVLNAESNDSSLRGRIADSPEAIQNKNESARSATLKASSGAGVGVVREGEGSDFAIRKNPCIQAPTPSLKENAHSQKGDYNADLSAELRKEMDCFGQNPRNDDNFLDSSRYALKNDESFMDCHDSALPNLAMTKKGVDSRSGESIADSTRTAQIAQIIKFAKKVLQ